MQVQSLGWEDPWSRKWQSIPVFLPGKFRGQEEPGELLLLPNACDQNGEKNICFGLR